MDGKSLNKLAKGLQAPGTRLRAQGLRGSSRAWLLSQVARKLERPVVVLTPGMAEARDFAGELSFFMGADRDREGLPWDSRVVLFPTWDAAPFENMPPHPEVSARRTTALFRALNGGPFIFVAPIEATFRALAAPDEIDGAAVPVGVGETLGRDDLVLRLIRAGYRRVTQVEERGEVSVRGGLVDVFAPHYHEPLRIEFFGDEVESIRRFDPATQRSTGRFEEVVLVPAREVVAGEEESVKALGELRNRCHKLGFNRSRTVEALEPLKDDPFTPLRDCFLPYYHEEPTSFWDYFPPETLVVLDGSDETLDRVDQFPEDALRAHERAVETGRLVPPFEDAYVSGARWRDGMGDRAVLELDELMREGVGETLDFDASSNDDIASLLKRNRGSDRLLAPLVEVIEKDRSDGRWVCLVCRGAGAAQKLRDLLGEYGLALGSEEPFAPPGPEKKGTVGVCLGALERGFRLPAEGITLITDSEIFGRKGRRPPPRRGMLRSSLADLKVGDYIVHSDFGIGRYNGMVRLEVEGDDSDYLYLEYAGEARLYLPVTRLNVIQRYTAPGDGEVRLDKLGGVAWQKACKKAAEGIEQMAHELLDIYARRQMASRPGYGEAGLSYREFSATFPYEETRDQDSAISEVMEDMGSDKPMDRLICGDVGYGKTEVAIRAAFRAVDAGRQVAVLAPTTVLAAQHHHSFAKRFEGYPVNVEMLSRFVEKGEQAETVKKAATGGVDIIVGTHRLLQADIKYKNLGLVVIDEEHRFGVAQKEKIKKLRNHVDVLALSATPIPRTLQMGLTGVRNLSVIETPPADRVAVRTRVARFDDDLVRETINRELARGGQVYFVHNRVKSISSVADHLRNLIPGIRLGVGHGQMGEKQLKNVMESFVSGEIEVLVCTAIIESGLDIPRANTIIIDRADMFGLADLYQLRGRVGRSNLRAYCYLLVPEEREVTEDARKRLSALQQFTELGAGFKVAIHDLEIRGAGDMLGKNQSGHIAAIGFDLYAELLEEAVHKLRGEPHVRPPEPEIRLRVHAHFPENYVDDARMRLELYERLTRMESPEDIDETRYEFVDRFGPLPGEVENLLEVMKIRLRLMGLMATGLDYGGEWLVLSFGEEHGIDPAKVITLAASEPDKCRLTPDNKVRWKAGKLEDSSVIEAAGALLSRIEGL